MVNYVVLSLDSETWSKFVSKSPDTCVYKQICIYCIYSYIYKICLHLDSRLTHVIAVLPGHIHQTGHKCLRWHPKSKLDWNGSMILTRIAMKVVLWTYERSSRFQTAYTLHMVHLSSIANSVSISPSLTLKLYIYRSIFLSIGLYVSYIYFPNCLSTCWMGLV